MSEILHKDLVGDDIHELKVNLTTQPPNSIPKFVGQGLYDIVNKKLYIAQGTSLATDWITTPIPPFLVYSDTRTISWTSVQVGAELTYQAEVNETELILTASNVTDFSEAVLTIPQVISLLTDQHTRLIMRTGSEEGGWAPVILNGLELDPAAQKIKLSQNLSETGNPTFDEITLTIKSKTPLLTLTAGGVPTAASAFLDSSKGVVVRGDTGSTSSFTLQNENGVDVLSNPVSSNQLVVPSLAMGVNSPGVIHADQDGLLSSSKLVDADVDAAAAIAGTKVVPDFGSQNITTTGSLFVDTIESNTNDIGILTGNENKVIDIGTGSGFNTINLGGINSTVNISGATYTTPVDYVSEDKNIVVNFNSSGQDSPDSGLYVQEEFAGPQTDFTDAVWQLGNTVRYTVDALGNGVGALAAGEFIRITGFVAGDNNGTFKVLAVDPAYVDVINPKRTDATADESAATALGARLILNGYIHVGSDRMSWEVRAPAHLGIIQLKPQAVEKVLQLTSESTDNVIVKFNTNLTIDQDLQKSASAEFAALKVSNLGLGVVHSDTDGNFSSSQIVDADVSGSAAITGTKIVPDFGSQNITTTGDATAKSLKVTGAEPVGGATLFSSATNGLVLRGQAGTGAQFRLISDLGVSLVTITDVGQVTLHNLTTGLVKATSGALSSALLVDADVSATAAIQGSKIQAADATQSGVVSTASQTFAGDKTFNGNVAISGFSVPGIIHNDSTGLLSSSLIMNADVDASAAISATKLANQPNGNISATTVQDAIDELDSEKVAKAGDTLTGSLNFATNAGIESSTATATLNIATNPNTTVLNVGTGNSVSAINIGTGSSGTTINIGGPGDTVNITGSLNSVNVIDMEVTDKNIVLNKGGAAASAGSAGIDIEEAGSIVAYARVDGARTSWEFKTPSSSGSFKITPSVVGFSAEFLIPSLTGNVVYTFPSVSETLVGRDTTDELTNKTILEPIVDKIIPYNVDGTFEIDSTAALKIPSGTTAERSTFTGADGMIRFNTTTNVYEAYSNSVWSPLNGGKVVNISSTATLVNETRYLTNTFAGPFSVTLPEGATNSRIEIKDALYTWQNNNLTVLPALGQRIDGFAINEPLICDIDGGWIILDWDSANSRWNLSTNAIVDLNDVYATESYPGIVSTETQTFAGTKKFNDGIILESSSTPAVAPSSGVQVYAKADNKLYTLNSAGVEQAVGAGGSIVSVTQNAHEFVAADVGRPVYLNGSTYAFARADTEAAAEVAGLINRVIDLNTFEVCLGGEVTSVGANLVAGGGALVPGEFYFLSATENGKITATAPSVVGQISKPVGVARTSTAIDFFNMRGSAVGGSNVYTQISLGGSTANPITTTIQNTSAYDAVELNGFIYINATAKYRFTFKSQVTKKGDATDYLISYQTSGDTPPTGFNITVTTGGLVQVTLPATAGFSSAIAQFSLNGPAVGTSLPLSIDSSNVSFGTVRAKDSNGITFQNSGSTGIASLTNAGYLLTPNIPAFYAWQTGGVFSTLTGAFGTIAPKFGNTRLNVNNCYDASNGRFIAPVNGIYEFHFGITHRWSTGAGNLEPTFYLNGSNISPRGCGYSSVTATGDHDFVHVHMMLSLTAGQYVQCGIHACGAGTDYYYGENLGYFSGKLIG